ncbi:MAG: fibrobacter succinogenes major paralogous domain-containing protein [Paludibacteraceae bacterium]|nr:fibrobacter succinogenes major paralogous domain-containing protein [Paludibacteraceae bacterium]
MRKMIYALMALVMMVGGMECSAQTVSGKVAGHDYVDLGLPSGTKWATYNVGATKPTEYGDYFAWSETKPKAEYSWDTYKWLLDGSLYTKYRTDRKKRKVDNKTVLDAEDDAATANWGKEWRMPTAREIYELIDACKWKWVEDFMGSGVNGRLGTSKKNGATIFLPAAGYRGGTDLNDAGYYGYYWSSSLNEDYSYFANNLDFDGDYFYRGISYRSNGQSVRAVLR